MDGPLSKILGGGPQSPPWLTPLSDTIDPISPFWTSLRDQPSHEGLKPNVNKQLIKSWQKHHKQDTCSNKHWVCPMPLHKYEVRITTYKYTGWAKKPDHFWTLITLEWLAVERHVVCQKFANLSRKKHKSCIAVCFNIICLICINIHYAWNYTDNKRPISCQKDWWWFSRSRVPMLISSGLTMCVNDRCCFVVCRVKIH